MSDKNSADARFSVGDRVEAFADGNPFWMAVTEIIGETIDEPWVRYRCSFGDAGDDAGVYRHHELKRYTNQE